MCTYEATIATPHVCKLGPDFERVHVASQNSVAAPPSNTPLMSVQGAGDSDGSEDWILQLSELDDGRFMCSAYTHELRSAGSKLKFAQFEFTVQVENLPLPASVPAQSTQVFIVRAPGRLDVPYSQLQLAASPRPQRASQIKGAPSFDGELSLLKVYA